MAKASDLAERMRQTALKDKPQQRTTVDAPDSAQTAVHESPAAAVVGEPAIPPAERASSDPTHRTRARTTSRYTIDLELNQRRALKLFALNLDADASEVVRVLLSLLQESDEIRREVSTRIEAARRNAVMQ